MSNELQEIWTPIKDFECAYEISNYGRVRSLDRYIDRNNAKSLIKGKVLTPMNNQNNYLFVVLKYKHKKKRYYIHRLVAEYFVDNLKSYTEVNHKDENKENNFFLNLEWCTREYNMNYGTRANRTSAKKINHPKCSRKVIQYSMDGRVIKIYPSAAEAERQLNIPSASIINCCRNNRGVKQTHNYIFKYYEQ